MENYKEDIQQTRVGSLGSSDARLLAQVATLGAVPKSAYKRLAVCKGLIPQEEIPRTAAIKAGDDIEMLVFEHLKSQDERYESNPLWISDRYSRKNARLISHPDIVLRNDGAKTLNVYEVKTTRYNIEETKQTYRAQCYVHYLLAKELASKYGKDWKVKVSLVHYSTDGLDLGNGIEFDPARLSVVPLKFPTPCFDVEKAMDVVDAFLEDYNEYYEGDEIDGNMLPEKVRNEFDLVSQALLEIKEREATVNAFKERLYSFMCDKDIKSIKCDAFSIVRVDETESHSFDAKGYIEKEMAAHPRKTKKLLKQYDKVTKKKGYCQIKVKRD